MNLPPFKPGVCNQLAIRHGAKNRAIGKISDAFLISGADHRYGLAGSKPACFAFGHGQCRDVVQHGLNRKQVP